MSGCSRRCACAAPNRVSRWTDWTPAIGRGEATIRELEHALLACEVLGDRRRQAVAEAMRRYIDGCRTRMGAEEREVLPAALQHLTADEGARPDAGFAANREPLTGRHEAHSTFRPLFSKILVTTRAPVGSG